MSFPYLYSSGASDLILSYYHLKNITEHLFACVNKKINPIYLIEFLTRFYL